MDKYHDHLPNTAANHYSLLISRGVDKCIIYLYNNSVRVENNI